MRDFRLLVLTLALNAGLAVAAVYVFSQPVAVTWTTFEPAVVRTNTRLHKRTLVKTTNVYQRVPGEKFTWHQVETPDYKAYIANLRAVSCPEETIRDIILAEINKLFAARVKAIRPPNRQNQYWKTLRPFGRKEDFEFQRTSRALEKEKTALLKELLGTDPNKEAQKEMGHFDYWERMYDFLSEDKREKAREVQDRFQELNQEIWQRNAGGPLEEEDQKELNRLQKEQLAEMAKFLAPQEMEEYELRSSQTASQLRHDLDGFEPSPEEFRDIFRIKKMREDDLSWNNHDPEDKAMNDRRQKAQLETDKEIKTLLGDDRYKEYERAKAYEYKELVRLTERQGLPKEAAVAVFDMKKTVEEQASKLRSNKLLTPEQRNETLKAVRVETEKAVSEALGEKAYKKYKDRNGWWISNLASGN